MANGSLHKFAGIFDDTKIMNNKSVHQLLDRCKSKQMNGKMLQNILNSRFNLAEFYAIHTLTHRPGKHENLTDNGVSLMRVRARALMYMCVFRFFGKLL